MLSPESVTGGERKLIGSMFLIEANKLDEVREKMEQDVYWTTGVVRNHGRGLPRRATTADMLNPILNSGTSLS